MVTRLVGELRVDVHDVELGARAKGIAHEDVIERLGVAFEDERVAIALGKRLDQVVERTRFEGRERGRELEVVEVAQDDHVGARVDREDVLREVAHQPRLLGPLQLRRTRGRLEVAHERLVAALRVEVVRDDEQVARVEGELAGERLPAAVPCRARRIDAARAERELRLAVHVPDDGRRRGGPARTIDEGEPAIRAEEEDLTNVPAGLPAILVVDRVDLAPGVGRAARGLDRRDETANGQRGVDGGGVRRSVVVLDLLDRDEVRGAQVCHHEAGERVELGLRIAGVEVLDVEGGDRELRCARRARGLFGEAAGHGRRRRRQLDHEVAEVVVEHTDDGPRETIADVHRGDRAATQLQDLVVEDDPLGVPVAVAGVADPAPAGPRTRPRAVVGEDRDLVERVARSDDDRVVDLDEHALEGLVEVDAVFIRIEHAARLHVAGRRPRRRVVLDDDRRRDASSDADHGREREAVAARHDPERR